MEMTSSHPLLAEQFGAVVLELRAGRSHEDALRRMADRAGADDIRAFATLLIQSTKLGSSIAQTLRIYSSEMREKRRLRAEEKAHRLPVLISIPLVACMLPVHDRRVDAAGVDPRGSGGDAGTSRRLKMNGGLKAALLVSGVTLAGCTTTTQEVKVRPLDPAAAIRNKGDEVAVARGQLALGNVGLALEAFHIAQRARPYDPAPAAGIGDCYAAMGRYDIAESSYEVALSLAPRDHALLLGLASIVERGGDLRRASDIRAEAGRFQRTAQIMAAQAAAVGACSRREAS